MFYLVYSYIIFFTKKLTILLILECFMMMVISSFYILNSFMISFISLILTVFMVLDSVFGLSILLNCSRFSGNFMSNLFCF